jgi:hypothetical protein
MGVMAKAHLNATRRSPDFHYNLPNSASELIVLFWIVICYICGLIHADVGRFIRGKNDAGGVFDSGLGYLLVVDKKLPQTALPQSSPVVGKIEPDGHISRGQRLIIGDPVFL